MTVVAVIVPVLGRPHRVEPLLESVMGATEQPYRVFFVPNGDDNDEIEALVDAGADFISHAGNYAEKIRFGVGWTDEPLVFAAADDLEFHYGWLEEALVVLEQPGVEVVGVNDLIPRGFDHATHFLMTRDYAERTTAGGEPGPFYDGYHHWYCDNELIETAEWRSVYAYAPHSRVEHLHPLVRKAPNDDTYRIGSEQSKEDEQIFLKRRELWGCTSQSLPG